MELLAIVLKQLRSIRERYVRTARRIRYVIHRETQSLCGLSRLKNVHFEKQWEFLINVCTKLFEKSSRGFSCIFQKVVLQIFKMFFFSAVPSNIDCIISPEVSPQVSPDVDLENPPRVHSKIVPSSLFLLGYLRQFIKKFFHKLLCSSFRTNCFGKTPKVTFLEFTRNIPEAIY